MKTLKSLGFIAIVALVTLSCKNNEQPEVKTVETESTAEMAQLDPNATYAKAEFNIEGMTCPMGCAKSIEKKLANLDGVKSAKVDYDRKLAMVEYNEDIVTPNSLEETVKKVGETYKVHDMKTVDSFSEKEQE